MRPEMRKDDEKFTYVNDCFEHVTGVLLFGSPKFLPTNGSCNTKKVGQVKNVAKRREVTDLIQTALAARCQRGGGGR